jgi:hypothetical protein
VASLSGTPLPDVVWLATQAIPSPEIVTGVRGRGGGSPEEEPGAHFGMRWQFTPLLYSFGVHRRASHFRAIVVEPFVRQVGSVELFLSPEYLAAEHAADRWSLRLGTRSYFPIASRGEYLSISIGTSYSTLRGGGVGYEVGAYTLFGLFGAQITYSPSPSAPTCIVTLRVRYF